MKKIYVYILALLILISFPYYSLIAETVKLQYSDLIKEKKLFSSGLKTKALKLLKMLGKNPYQIPALYEKLVGDLRGSVSRRINIQHRLIYQVLEEEQIVKIIRMCNHYK